MKLPQMALLFIWAVSLPVGAQPAASSSPTTAPTPIASVTPLAAPIAAFPPRPLIKDGLSFYQTGTTPQIWSRVLSVQNQAATRHVDLAIVVLDDMAGYAMPLQQFSQGLARAWSLSPNSILLAICKKDQSAWIELGSAWDGSWKISTGSIVARANRDMRRRRDPILPAVNALGQLTIQASNVSPPFGPAPAFPHSKVSRRQRSVQTRNASPRSDGQSSSVAVSALIVILGFLYCVKRNYKLPMALLGILFCSMLFPAVLFVAFGLTIAVALARRKTIETGVSNQNWQAIVDRAAPPQANAANSQPAHSSATEDPEEWTTASDPPIEKVNTTAVSLGDW